ncbi:hypothetical protein ACMFMF_002777 [Clarireedia jacksonii]
MSPDMEPSVLIEGQLNNRRVTPKDAEDVAKYLYHRTFISGEQSRDVDFDVRSIPVNDLMDWVGAWLEYSDGYQKNDQELGKLVTTETDLEWGLSHNEICYERIGIEGGRRFVEMKPGGQNELIRKYSPPVSSDNKPSGENLELRQWLQVPPTESGEKRKSDYTITKGQADNLDTIPEFLRVACLLENYEVAVLPSEQREVDMWLKQLRLPYESDSNKTYVTAGYLDGHGFATYRSTDSEAVERTYVIFRERTPMILLIDARSVDYNRPMITEEIELDPWWVQMNNARSRFQ